jgi:hypothetical protein
LTGLSDKFIGPGSTIGTVGDLAADTTYFFRVRANPATGSAFSPSEYSAIQSVRTLSLAPGGPAPDGDVVSHLHNWLTNLQREFQSVSVLLPQLETTVLNTTDRRRLLGSGVRRYGFIEKVFEVSTDYPQFWPPFGEGREELSEYVSEIDVLRNLLIWFRSASRIVQDLLLIAGDHAFRVAGAYYAFARTGARRKNLEAAQVFEMLRLFWHRRRRTTEEPTVHEVERDLRALLRGTKDGEIVVRNESDRIIKGEKVVIDNTQRKPRGGMKVVETEEVE